MEIGGMQLIQGLRNAHEAQNDTIFTAFAKVINILMSCIQLCVLI